MSPQTALSTAQMCLFCECVVFSVISYEQNHAYNANVMSFVITEETSMQKHTHEKTADK